MTFSLQRLQIRTTRASRVARAFVTLAVVSLVLAFVPCCDPVGQAEAATAHAAASVDGHASTVTHNGDHAPAGSKGPCNVWLDIGANAAAKSAVLVPFMAKASAGVPHTVLVPVTADVHAWQPHRLSVSAPEIALYLRYARLII